MNILKRSSKTWVSEVLANLDTMWDTIETTISESGSASYIVPLQQFIFNFLTKSLVGADPSSSPEIAESGYVMLDRWLALQLLPTVKIGVLQPLEEIFLHSWAYPFLLVSGDYKKLYQFVEKEGNYSFIYSSIQ
jgi:hydroperoxide lyase